MKAILLNGNNISEAKGMAGIIRSCVRSLVAVKFNVATLSTAVIANMAIAGHAFAADEAFDLVNPEASSEQPISLVSDFKVSVYGEGEYDSFLGKSELWADNWGVSAELKQSAAGDVYGLPKESSFLNLDVKRRFGKHDKSNIELGLGWQELNIDSQLDASGPRLSVSGKYNVLKDFQVYGLTSYFPELEDDVMTDTDLSAYEFEAGLLYKPLPSLELKAGYRVFNLDLEDPILEELGSTSGFLLGTDLSW